MRQPVIANVFETGPEDDASFFRPRRAGDRVRLVRLVSEVRITLVAHQPHVVFFADRQDALVLIWRYAPASWIAWRVQNQQPRFLCDGLLDCGRLYAEAIFRLRFHAD